MSINTMTCGDCKCVGVREAGIEVETKNPVPMWNGDLKVMTHAMH